MDAKNLSERMQQDDDDTKRLLRLIESMLPPQSEMVVRTYLSTDTTDPWRGDYANLERHSR